MATFPDYNPVFSASKTDITNTRTVQFGDGYQQRFTFGINQKAKQWTCLLYTSPSPRDRG